MFYKILLTWTEVEVEDGDLRMKSCWSITDEINLIFGLIRDIIKKSVKYLRTVK